MGQPKVIENAKILIANTAMDTDKIKIYGSRVRVDSMNKASKNASAATSRRTRRTGWDVTTFLAFRVLPGGFVVEAYRLQVEYTRSLVRVQLS